MNNNSKIIFIYHFNVLSFYLTEFPGTAKDKIFVASGNIVRGFTKKGKMFLEFDTNLAENITNMLVHIRFTFEE